MFIPILHSGIGEVMGSGFYQAYYEQNWNQSSIYQTTREHSQSPGISVSSELLYQISWKFWFIPFPKAQFP